MNRIDEIKARAKEDMDKLTLSDMAFLFNEIEINRRLAETNTAAWHRLTAQLAEAEVAGR